ncbi:MAG: prepilin-type N-terminal cleavage/methylation domain-containing protein, partial [Luminiphilus sp.]|nr:prepilin-type N-terminal cleavage/methylation domain-containing protein [Luminiphilus sp.]
MAAEQTGLSLVELMVAIAIASFVALAGTTLYVTTVGAGKELYDEASQTEQIFAITSALSADIRRAGYRGDPTALSTYLVSTRGSGGAVGDEGDYPAVEFSTTGPPTAAGNTNDCILVQYRRKHTCAS